MSIKPDAWIKRMAESEGMIEPFSEIRCGLTKKEKNSFHMAFQVLAMTYVVPMSLKFLQIFIPRPLILRFLTIIALWIYLQMYALFRLIFALSKNS